MVLGWSYRNPWLLWIKTLLVHRPQCWCYLMFVLFLADKQNDNYYSGSGALGRQLKMQFSRHRSQQPLLGLTKPSPRAGFAHLDSHKTKACLAELCPGLLALSWSRSRALCYRGQHWDVQGSPEPAAEGPRCCWNDRDRDRTSRLSLLGLLKDDDVGVSNLPGCIFPLLMASAQYCVLSPQI